MEEGDQEVQPVGVPDLADLCRRLNEADVRYVIFGGMACLLHGFERMTKDIDVFVSDEPANIGKALRVLSAWGEGFARELTVADVQENVVVRIFDRFILDVASKVWKLELAEACARRRLVQVEGVEIPVLSRRDLMTSKTTYRDRDAIDLRELRTLGPEEPGRAAGPGDRA